MDASRSTPMMLLPLWEEYRGDAPHESEEWAASDRGWCFDAAREGCEHNAVGNYLRYDETRGPNGETVHACAYHMEQAPLASCYTTFRHGSGWFHTIEEAKAFIVNAVSEAFQSRAAEGGQS